MKEMSIQELTSLINNEEKMRLNLIEMQEDLLDMNKNLKLLLDTLNSVNDTDVRIKIFEHDEKELKEPYVLYKNKKTTLKKGGKDYAFANERTEIQFHVPTNSIKFDNNFDLNKIQSN